MTAPLWYRQWLFRRAVRAIRRGDRLKAQKLVLRATPRLGSGSRR